MDQREAVLHAERVRLQAGHHVVLIIGTGGDEEIRIAHLFFFKLRDDGRVRVEHGGVGKTVGEFRAKRRILLELTDLFRARPDDIERTVEAATELDVLQGRARFSDSINGVEPRLSKDGAFELLAARHPLLKSPVPVTIRILPPATVLLITGPNTGGKTVALKTAGLLALMAQSGLRIPVADGSRLPVFRTVFADIGDEQSIEASLSTFSAHITNIASMDRDLKEYEPGLLEGWFIPRERLEVLPWTTELVTERAGGLGNR